MVHRAGIEEAWCCVSNQKYSTVAERIIANSYVSNELTYNGTGCWIWLDSYTNTGYGRMNFRYKRGPRKGKVYSMKAHRAAVQHMTTKRVTPKTVIMHLCNNRACVNPAHLQGGTQRKNVRQCVAEGRRKTPFRDPEMKRAI